MMKGKTMRGIDISSGTGAVNFQALKAAGYEFVIARAGYGSSITQADARFHGYVRDALDAGLHVGAYWFIYARTLDEAVENAKCFVEVCNHYRGRLDMPLYIDYEYDSTRYYEQEVGVKEHRAIATEYIRQAAEYVEKCGYYSGVYLNPDYIKNHVDLPKLSHFTLWLAQWGAERPAYDCGIWQTHGDTKIPEAAGGVDLNQCFVDFPTTIRRNGLNGYKATETPQAESASGASGDKWEVVDTGDGYTIKLGGKKG